MSGYAFLFLDAIAALIFQPYIVIGLIVIQTLHWVLDVHQHFWLPFGLLGVSIIWCAVTPLFR